MVTIRNLSPSHIVTQETLEENLGAVIQGITIDESILEWLVAALKESHREEKAYHDGAVSTLQAHYNKLQNRIDQAYTDKLDGKIPEEFMLRKMNEWRKEQASILSQILAYQRANESYVYEGIKLLELANTAHSLYLQQPAQQKARLIKLCNRTASGIV